jgi:Mlc titration factor MtfA (ptsG expression regulator)
MLDFIRHWFDRRIVERSDVTEGQWQAAFDSLPLLDSLSADEKQGLRELAILFCYRKTFEGAHGLSVTREMALEIALQACLPILNLGLDDYAGWTSVIVYPSGFETTHVYVDDYGVEHVVMSELDGEAWQRGPVILAWDMADHAGEIDAYNLVIHEFAHKLDMQNGSANGFPPLHAGMDAATWSEIFSRQFDDFRRKCDAGLDIGIDCYAASSPAEFFAVMSEVFFERPDLLDQHYPSVYAQMRLYYRQDPLARLRAAWQMRADGN